MNFTIISCSLDANSRSRRLAELANQSLSTSGHQPLLLDLRTIAVPPFDNDDAFDHPSYRVLYDAIAQADGVFIAAPVYNWGLSSSTKQLIELTGATGVDGRQAAWFDKIVTFLCAGGLPHSYMAYSSIAMSLMLDFKCLLNPYMVYATDRDWTAALEPSTTLRTRLDKTIAVKLELAACLQSRTHQSSWEV